MFLFQASPFLTPFFLTKKINFDNLQKEVKTPGSPAVFWPLIYFLNVGGHRYLYLRLESNK